LASSQGSISLIVSLSLAYTWLAFTASTPTRLLNTPFFAISASCMYAPFGIIQLVVAVRVGAGPVEPIGMPAAFLADSQAALPLLQRLVNLGVLRKDLNDGTLAPFCAMLPAVDPGTGLELNASQQSSRPSKELVEYNVVSKNGTGEHLELTGIICPEGFYDATTATCSWTDRADAPSDASRTADDQGDQDKGAAPEPSSECPLCAFIKGGGCAEAFAPFHACVMEQADAVDRRDARKKAAVEGAQNGDGHGEGKKDGEEKPTPNCMPLFAPVAECMVADGAKREYYHKFIDDFPHLFENRSKAK